MHTTCVVRRKPRITSSDIARLLSNREREAREAARMKAAMCVLVFAAACGSSGGSPTTGDDDDGPTPDSQLPDPTPGTIRISGQATETGFGGTSPVEG
jgi:hypothetical protein